MDSTLPPPQFHAVIVAGGSGKRAAQHLPKQYMSWRGKRVLAHSIAALYEAGAVHIAVVVPDTGDPLAQECVPEAAPVTLVTAGNTRQASVRAGLEALAIYSPQRVLIHDAARPAIPNSVIARLLAALGEAKGAIPVLPMADSLIVANGNAMGDPVERDRLRRVQTPQAFAYDAILTAHRNWPGAPDAGDDAQVAQAAGHAIELVAGDEALKKLTYAADFNTGKAPLMRIGSGYDVHRLTVGEELWLGGVKIDHTHGLAGHSDADVALHAITDAILGAVGAGDIGHHFSPSDPRWAGAASDQFLHHAAMLAHEAGYGVGNIDLTIICEAPRIGPHREAMRQRIAEILSVAPDRISVKATTTEGLGPTGRREGIAAQAVVMMIAKEEL